MYLQIYVLENNNINNDNISSMNNQLKDLKRQYRI